MSESTTLREAIARVIFKGGWRDPEGEFAEQHWVEFEETYLAEADDVLAVIADFLPESCFDPPAYLALDLWMALGLSPRDFDAYLERNGWADTWANLLDGVRRKSGRRGCSKPRERCVLIAGHVGPCMGASDVGSSERLPGAAFGGEQDD